ncbi:hypothetical protein QQF64_002217, partial [Cirrhinus molitorella]
AHWNPLDTEPLRSNRETNHSLPICSIEVFNGPYLSLSSEQDIQEFYEVTLLNYQKSCEQKLVEVNHMAEQWEHTATNSTSPTEGPQPASTSPELREEIHMELTVEEPAAGSANTENRPPAVQGSQHQSHSPACMNPALMSSPWYRYQDDDSPPPEHSFPRLTNEVRAPELVHVSEKNLSEIENVHGFVSHSHISPLK